MTLGGAERAAPAMGAGAVGRVNRWDRLVRSWRAGAVSVDGTGWFHETNGQLAELTKFIDETWTP